MHELTASEIAERLWHLEEQQWRRLYDNLYRLRLRPVAYYPPMWEQRRNGTRRW